MFSPVNVSVWFVCKCKASFQSIDKFIEHRLIENETIGSQQKTICIVFEEGTVDEECLDDFVRVGPNLKSFADVDPLDPLQLSGSSCNSSEPNFVNYKRTERIKTEWGTENSTVSSNGNGDAVAGTDCNFEWDFGSSDSVAMTDINNVNLNLDAVASIENIIPIQNNNNYSNSLIPAEDGQEEQEQDQFIILLGNENDDESEGIINSDHKTVVVDSNLFELESVHSRSSYELSLNQNGVSLTEIDIEEVSEDALSFCGSEFSSTRSSSPGSDFDSDSGLKNSLLNYGNVDFGNYSPPPPEERFDSFETGLTNFQESQKMENISYQFNSYADYEPVPAPGPAPTPAERPPYQCSIANCLSSYKNQRTLQLHLKSHTEVLPYMCPEDGCGKLFSTDFQLTFHMKQHYYTCGENQDNVVRNTKLNPLKEKHVVSKHIKPTTTATSQNIRSQHTPRFENKNVGLVKKLPIKSITSQFNSKNKSEADPGTSLFHYKTGASTGGVRESKKFELEPPAKMLSNSRGRNKSTSSNSSASKSQPKHGRPTIPVLPTPKNKDSINNNSFHLQCRYCKKFQRSLTVLNMHERIHTGEKEFHCQHCSRGFTWKQAWKVHEGKCKEAKGGSSVSKIKTKQSHSHEEKTLIMPSNTNFFGDREAKLKVRTTKDKDREMFFLTTKKSPVNKTTMKLVNSKNVMDFGAQPESRGKIRVPKTNSRRLSPHSQLKFAASVLTKISEGKTTFISKTTGQVSFQQNQPNKRKLLGPKLIVNNEQNSKKPAEKKEFKTNTNCSEIGNIAKTPVKDAETFSLECRFCKRISRCKPELILHERIHTGEKPFICSHCLRSFTWKQSRDVHMKICKKKSIKIQNSGATSGEIPAKSTTQFTNIGTKENAKGASGSPQQQKSKIQSPISKPESQQKLKNVFVQAINSVGVKDSKSKIKSNKREETHQTEKMDNVNAILSLKTKTGDKVRKAEIEDRAVASTSTSTSSSNSTSTSAISSTSTSTSIRPSTSSAGNSSPTTRDKLYICSYCSKAFTHKGNMATHERVHTGEEPFSCRCEKRFKSAAGLAYHLNKPTSFQCAKVFY